MRRAKKPHAVSDGDWPSGRTFAPVGELQVTSQPQVEPRVVRPEFRFGGCLEGPQARWRDRRRPQAGFNRADMGDSAGAGAHGAWICIMRRGADMVAPNAATTDFSLTARGRGGRRAGLVSTMKPYSWWDGAIHIGASSRLRDRRKANVKAMYPSRFSSLKCNEPDVVRRTFSTVASDDREQSMQPHVFDVGNAGFRPVVMGMEHAQNRLSNGKSSDDRRMFPRTYRKPAWRRADVVCRSNRENASRAAVHVAN